MKNFNFLLWIGLVINVVILGAAWCFSISLKDMMSEISYSQRDMVGFLEFMITPFFVAIIIQVISVFALLKKPKLGLALAIIGSIIMLPLSLVFIAGYLFNYEKVVNNGLATFSKQSVYVGLNFKTSTMTMQGALFVIIGLLVGFIGVGTGWLIFGVGVAVLCNSFRLKDRIMIGMTQDMLILTPTLYSDTYLIPLKDVFIIKNDSSVFKIHIKSDVVDRKCTFRKKMIMTEGSPVALDDILSNLVIR